MIDLLPALLLALALPPDTTLSVDPAASNITFHIIHKLHHVDGVARQLEGKAAVKKGGQVLAMVRIPVATFQSGDANRDEHMLEALEAGKYPFVVVKGISRLGSGGELPEGPVEMHGELELHGVTTPVDVPLSIEPRQDGSVRVRGHFDVSLDAHRIQRPSLLFVKIEDTCGIDLDLVLRRAER